MTPYFFLDPDDELDYTWDFERWLDGDSIDQATVTAVGVTLVDYSNSDTTVTAWVKDPTASRAELVCSITTTGGRRTDRTIHLVVQHR